MAENSKIEWTDHTFNPWIGCTKVSAACDHCYAEVATPTRTMRAAGSETWGPHAPRQRTSAANWKKPLAWNAQAKSEGRRYRVFCASLADVFDNHPSILPEWRADLWALIAATPHLDWLLLTKRPQNITRFLPQHWGPFWSHVWLGTTVENQTEADRRIPHLLAVPAAVRFLSVEPMLGLVDLRKWIGIGPHIGASTHVGADGIDRCDFTGNTGELDWVICGGESGPGARPMHPDWPRSLRDQCVAAGVPFFFKQWGEWLPMGQDGFTAWAAANIRNNGRPGKKWLGYASFNDGAGGPTTQTVGPIETCNVGDMLQAARVGKRIAGRVLDGRTWDEMPGAAR